MSCGCKKRREDAARAAQQPAQIVMTEMPRPPQPVQPPNEQQQVENIVEKLNNILTPQ